MEDDRRHDVNGPFALVHAAADAAVAGSSQIARKRPSAAKKIKAHAKIMKYQERMTQEVKQATNMLEACMPEVDKEAAKTALQEAPEELQVLS